MHLDHFMLELSKEIGDDVNFNSEVPGAYLFPLDEETIVNITAIPREGYSLHCIVGELPSENEGEFLNEAMLGNLYGRATTGAVLGLDIEGKRLTISQTIDYSIDYKEFRDILEDFLNTIEFWKQEIQSYYKK